jgi:hypothetical protein
MNTNTMNNRWLSLFCLFLTFLSRTSAIPTGAARAVAEAAAKTHQEEAAKDKDASSTIDIDIDIDACHLWLAPSDTGTKQQPKYGLFAGRPYAEHETIPNPELAIPLVDFVQEWNRHDTARNAHEIIEFVESFLWTSEYAGTKWEGNHSAPVVIPGIGVLASYHTGVSNVDFMQASMYFRDKPHGYKSGHANPARGANTPYYNATLRATQPIPAGMELFANFGDVWDGNYTDDFYQDKITRFDYDTADKIIDKLLTFFAELEEDLTTALQNDLLDFVLEKVLGTAAGKQAKTIRSLIPAHPHKLQRVVDAGGAFQYRYPDMIKSQKWLAKHGLCLDNLTTGPSTVVNANAGRGAFATRALKRGEIIAPSPMLHIANKDLLNMYKIQTVLGEAAALPEYNKSQPMGQQLLLNYCFGHPESSLLLFPLGSHVASINHHPAGLTPNAYITWSKDKSIPNQHDYHDVSVQELAKVNRIVIVMKVVALRDIAKGEEIFLDYGQEWQDAWNTHYDKWTQTYKHKPSWPHKAEDMRHAYQNKPLETRDTSLKNPYPPTVGTACFIKTQDFPDGKPMVSKDHYNIMNWAAPATLDQYNGDQLLIVDILSRTPAPSHYFNYTLLARVGPDHVEQVENVPHAACTFVDKPYTSDTFAPDAFRHSIGIMDNHFPQHWRDLRT